MTAKGPIAGVGRWVRSIGPQRRHVRTDVVAGLTGAISSVPDGMASGVLAGVNPVHGLYASFAGPIAGGLGASTRLMVITTTSAAALAAGSAISGLEPADRERAVVLLTVLAGALMVLAGIFRLGRYTRFVSHSVMLGFLTGVAANIVFGQLADLTGTTASGPNSVAKAIDVLTHPGRWDLASLGIGLAALVILVVLARTPLSVVSSLVALAAPTIVASSPVPTAWCRSTTADRFRAGSPCPSCPTSPTSR
jgi:SulP family sulfate permease